MNKFILRMMAIMIALTMSVGFVSCNDDDDNEPNIHLLGLGYKFKF